MSTRKSNLTEIKLTQEEEEQVQRVKYGCELYEKYVQIKQSNNTNNLELPRFGDYLHHFGFTPQSPSAHMSSETVVNAEETYNSNLTSTDSMTQKAKSSALIITNNENKTVCKELEFTEHNKMLMSEADAQSSRVGPLVEINDLITLSNTIAAPFLEPSWRQDVKSCALKKARCLYSWLCDNMTVKINTTSVSTIKHDKVGSMADGDINGAASVALNAAAATNNESNITNSHNKVEIGDANNKNVKMNMVNSSPSKREKTVILVDESNNTINSNGSNAVTNITAINTAEDKETTEANKENVRRRTSCAKHVKKFGKESDRHNAELAAAAAMTATSMLKPMSKRELVHQALQNRCASPQVLGMLYAVMLRAINVSCIIVHGEIKHLNNVCEPWAWNMVNVGDSGESSESCYLVDVSTAAWMTSHTQQTRKENESTIVTSQPAKKSTKEDKSRECELKAKKALSDLLNGECVLVYADPLSLLLNWEPLSYKSNSNSVKEDDKDDGNGDDGNRSGRSNYVTKVRNFYFTSAANAFYRSHYPMQYLSCENLFTHKEEEEQEQREEEEEEESEKTKIQEAATINKMSYEEWEQQICTDCHFYAFSLQLSPLTHWRYVTKGNVAHVSVINPEPAQTELCGLLFHGSASDVASWYHNNCKSSSNNNNSNNNETSKTLSTSPSKANLSSATSKTSSTHISSGRKSKVQSKSNGEQRKQEEKEEEHSLSVPSSAKVTLNGPCARCVWHEREEQTNTENFTVILPEKHTSCYTFIVAARHIRSHPYSAEIITSQENKYFTPVLMYSLVMSSSSSSSSSLSMACNVPFSTRFAQRHLSPSIAKVLSPLEHMYEYMKVNELEQEFNSNFIHNVKDRYRFTVMPTCSNVEAVAVVIRSNSDNNDVNCNMKTEDDDGNGNGKRCLEEAKNKSSKVTEQLTQNATSNISGSHTDMVEEKTNTTITFLPFNTETLCYDGDVVVRTCNVNGNSMNNRESEHSNINIDRKTCNGVLSAEIWLLYGAPDQNGIALRNQSNLTARDAPLLSTMEEPELSQSKTYTGLRQEKRNPRRALSAGKDLRQKEEEGNLPKLNKKRNNITEHNAASTGKTGNKTHTTKTTDNYFEQKELEYLTWHEALHKGQCFRRFVSDINLNYEIMEAKVPSEMLHSKNDNKDACIIRSMLSSRMEWRATLARLVGVTPALYNETLQ